MKKLILCVLILIIFVCHGCYLPIIYTESPTGSIDTSFITVGVTTKEDVVLRLGGPKSVRDESGHSERIFIYGWSTSRGVILGYGVSSTIGSTTYVKISFDENDIVKDYGVENR